MDITLKPYQAADWRRIGQFLVEHYQPDNRDGNWLRPTWDYMHSHPMLDESALARIGVWEDGGKIVGVAHYESRLGEAFFECHPEYDFLKGEMLKYAQENLTPPDDVERDLRIYVNDFDSGFETLVRQEGYHPLENAVRPLSQLNVPSEIPEAQMPDGFRVLSLADENNLTKINHVLWRGFNHPGEPPREEEEGRKKMQSSPNFQKDLTIVVADPEGQFRAFCGFWYVPENKYGVIEPLATDPDFRRMGLARAGVWEGVRRCRDLGAETIYVGSDQLFYLSLGFRVLYNTRAWIKKS
jgi:predicted N-acetyltransferase YhbS